VSTSGASTDVLRRARRIRVLLFDVDGVLTDGGVYLHADGSEMKRFDIKDGAGIVRARQAGLTAGIISARVSPATTCRAAALGMHPVIQGAADKLGALQELLASEQWDAETIAYMGDDEQDLPLLQAVGLATCPADAVEAVRSRVHWVSPHRGGFGAARALVDLVLRAQDLHAAEPLHR
jgi:3-deoxy-D-manno-octulosonate 8-phosphate phosphatase (KDO 8-P phosphatase)